MVAKDCLDFEIERRGTQDGRMHLTTDRGSSISRDRKLQVESLIAISRYQMETFVSTCSSRSCNKAKVSIGSQLS